MLDTTVFLFLGGFAAAAFAIAFVAGFVALDRSPAPALSRALESALVAFAGGFLARGFLFGILALLPHTPGAELTVGWALLLWPGAVDTIGLLFGVQPLARSDRLLWLATGVGAFTGMMDGLWRIHRWKGTGPLTFLLDVTWGLAGTTNACLFHVHNAAWSGHAQEPRTGAHRYERGFTLVSGFAITQGAVMSNTKSGAGTALYAHERAHVWQNRIFGPLYTLTYLAWMVLLFIPGIVAGLVSRAGAGAGIMGLCYYNNPWEAWAYRVGHRHGASTRTSRGPLIWGDGVVLVASLLFFAAIIALFSFTLASL